MTSIALIPQQIRLKTPYAVLCSFRVPSTEIDPDFLPSIVVCIGRYETQAEAKLSFKGIYLHPALIAAWCHQSMCDDDY